MTTTHQSAYGLPLSPPDTEFMRFLELRKAATVQRKRWAFWPVKRTEERA